MTIEMALSDPQPMAAEPAAPGMPPGSVAKRDERLPMGDLSALRAARSRAYWLRFGAGVEEDYAKSMVRQRRLPLIGMFVIFGLSFVLVPIYQAPIFGVSHQLAGQLLGFQLMYTAPTMFAAAAATYFRPRPFVTPAFQALAVVTIWAAMLVLRGLALQGQLEFPSSMVGIVVISVAIFGRFNWYRISLGSLAVLMLATLQELHFQGASVQANSRIYSYVLTALVAILGGYVIEVGHRLAWLNGRIAKSLGRIDELTGLANRSEFKRRFPRLLAQAKQARVGLAIVVLDVDHFKQINDTLGHLAGDTVLEALGEALLRGARRRPQDLLVRFGGEEMVIVWYDVSQPALDERVESLLALVRGLRVETTGSGALQKITASIGASLLVPDADAKPEDVLRQADQLMYRAKEEGRDRALVGRYVAERRAGAPT